MAMTTTVIYPKFNHGDTYIIVEDRDKTVSTLFDTTSLCNAASDDYDDVTRY